MGFDQKAIKPLERQWLMKYQEAKYRPHSRKADTMAARGELRDCKILSSVRIASSVTV
jgi:hypothetical protein